MKFIAKILWKIHYFTHLLFEATRKQGWETVAGAACAVSNWCHLRACAIFD